MTEARIRNLLVAAQVLAGAAMVLTGLTMVAVGPLSVGIYLVLGPAIMLAAIVLFGLVLLTHREVLARAHYEAGQVVFREGDRGEEVYVITAGEVEVIKELPEGATQAIARLGPGQFFGEMALITDAPRIATVRCIQPTDVLRIGRSDFINLFTHMPALRESFQRAVAERLEELQGRSRGPGSAASAGPATG